MVNSSRHWEPVALKLAERYTVIAPDLLGHGDSAAVRGDYSLGAHAASIRRPAGGDRDRASDHRRPLARRRRGDAVLLPVPPAGRAACAGVERRAGSRGQPAPAQRRAARRVGGALGGRPPSRARRALGHREADARPRARQGAGAAGRGACAAATRGSRGAQGLRAHAASGDRRPRPARQRSGSPLPAQHDADDDRLGRARSHDPDRARAGGPRGHPAQPLRAAGERSALPPPRGSRRARGGAPRLHGEHRPGA